MAQGWGSVGPQTPVSEAEEVWGGMSPDPKPTSSPSSAALLPPAPGGGVWEGYG